MNSVPPILYPADFPDPGGYSRIQKWLTVGTFAAALLFALSVLWRFEPAGQSFYPQCKFLRMTGWKCPGCGGMRAAHALLHGNWVEAWNYNRLAVLAFPGMLWLAIREVFGRTTGHWWKNPFQNVWLWIIAGIAATIFGIVRNLP